MAFCYHCGEEIEFINNGFGPIPIHPSGSCSGRSGYVAGRIVSAYRSTSHGEGFEFPFVSYPSYVNPNARCPVCSASVYFYQSPYGGRVFFDELGPPWPKHPCTDIPEVRRHFATTEGRRDFLIRATDSKNGAESTPANATAPTNDESECPQKPVALAEWQEEGWMPFIVTKLVPRPIGIEAEGNLFISMKGKPLLFRIQQSSGEARFYRKHGQLLLGYGLVQNTSLVLSALNECPAMLKMNPDLNRLILSSFILTRDGEVGEITLTVNGTELTEHRE